MAVGRTVALLLPACAGCSLFADIPGVIEGQGDGDVRRKQIVITSPLIEIELEDYVVAISVVEDDELAARATADNIQFTDESGDPLPYEVERVDEELGSLTAWVRLPVLGIADEPTVIFLRYGGPPVEPPPSEEVWPAIYAGAWHLSGPGPEYPDSTSARNTARVASASAPLEQDGAFGGALVFTDGTQRLEIVDPTSDVLDFGIESFSYSMWVRVDAQSGAEDVPWSKGGLADTEAGYSLQLATDDWVAAISDGATRRVVSFAGASIYLGDWTMLGVTVDRDSSPGLFCTSVGGDVTSCDETTGLGPLGSSRDVEIGRDFEGRIDEIRVYRGAVPQERFLVDLDNQNNPDFVRVSGEQELP